MSKKLLYRRPEIRRRPVEAEGMVCASIGTDVDPSGLGLGDGGELSRENIFDDIKLWED